MSYRRVFGTLAGVDTVWLDYMHVRWVSRNVVLIVSAIASLSDQEEHQHNYLHLWTADRFASDPT
jgi:hypothetical protein